MKKMLARLLSFLLLLTLTACEKEDVELAMDVAIAVLEEVEEYERSQEEGASSDSVEEIPPFSGDAYIPINGNVPFFVEEEITDESYEF